MYEPHCGLDNLMMSWGHDEYLYRFLKFNNAKLPDEALYMIRCEFLIIEIIKLQIRSIRLLLALTNETILNNWFIVTLCRPK